MEVSWLGHYVLIHALIQHVYLLKETSSASAQYSDEQRSLKAEEIDEVIGALRYWQTSFEQRQRDKAASAENHGAEGRREVGGSLARSAAALLRLAYIRLHTGAAPGRWLESRDWKRMVSSWSTTSLLERSLRLHLVVYQAIHALSTLVRTGVRYVAREKSRYWSIQQSCK